MKSAIKFASTLAAAVLLQVSGAQAHDASSNDMATLKNLPTVNAMTAQTSEKFEE